MLLGALAALDLFYLFGLHAADRRAARAPLAVRVVVAFAVLAPLGVCLGVVHAPGLGRGRGHHADIHASTSPGDGR